MLVAIAAVLLCAGAAASAATVHKANSTAYCDRGDTAQQRPGGGAYQTGPGIAASNRHRLGTKIYVLGKGGPGGRHRWRIRDRIGWGSELDFWVPSCPYAENVWGRRDVRYRIGWHLKN